MREPEAELQATANLSPVSPSPIHTASPLIVPALQDTADTIDAMVDTVLAAKDDVNQNHVKSNLADVAGDEGDVVDDDSFNDPYAEEDAPDAAIEPPKEQATDPNDDDYAKMFDSPVGSEEGEGEGEDIEKHEAIVPSFPRESNNIFLPSGASHTQPTVASQSVLDSSFAQSSAANDPAQSTTAKGQNGKASHMHDGPNYSNPESSLPQPAYGDDSVHPSEKPSSADLEQLVADLKRAQPSEPIPSLDPSAQSAHVRHPSQVAPTTTFPPSSSLPPRPPQPNGAPQSYSTVYHPSGSVSGVPANVALPPNPGQPSTYVAAGAPGTSTEAINSLPPPPLAGLAGHSSIASIPAVPFAAPSSSYSFDKEGDYQRKWEQFISDERQYMSEAKWDRFPEGSRIFIGNLSSDKVSKRNVFDTFHQYGRLAQISLKSAYGFVQYHTVDEGQRAIENLQGAEIKGRRIHLEISKLQDKSKKDRGRSPDRGGRSRDGGRRNDRFNNQGREDHRHGGRGHSPRRNDYNNDGYGRERGYYDSSRGRGRSRSPGYGRNNRDSYRRRSPSPYGRSQNNDAEIDLPRRYGADVPDVQIILQPDVNREFVTWVENALKSKSLKTEVMYLHPRVPKNQVIQRQAVEGVHAVVDLDIRSQNLGKVPVQAFDRSAGSSNVRFDQYLDLEPTIAAEVILRTKASAMPSYAQPQQPYNGAVGPNYSQPYGAPAHPPSSVGSYPQAPTAYPQPQQPGASAADIANLLGKVDNVTLQRLLSSIQGGAASVPLPQGIQSHGNPPGAAQHDIQAILGSLAGNTPSSQPYLQSQSQYATPYQSQGAPVVAPSQGADSQESATQVQNIMAQLARFRQ